MEKKRAFDDGGSHIRELEQSGTVVVVDFMWKAQEVLSLDSVLSVAKISINHIWLSFYRIIFVLEIVNQGKLEKWLDSGAF